MNCTPWGSKRSSATRTRRGRRGVWRMGSVGCVVCCPGRRTWGRCLTSGLRGCCWGITIRRASASATRAHPKYSGVKCCTSNVNPPSRLRGNDGGHALERRGAPPHAYILYAHPHRGAPSSSPSPRGRRDLSSKPGMRGSRLRGNDGGHALERRGAPPHAYILYSHPHLLPGGEGT